MKILLLGMPGSGKSTLGEKLGKNFKTLFLSSLRVYNAWTVKEGINSHDNAVLQIIGDAEAYILEGFPRTTKQAKKYDLPLDVVLYLSVIPQIGMERLLSSDAELDFDAALDNVCNYTEHTAPLIEFYKEMGILYTIDANGPPQTVYAKAVIALNEAGIIEAFNCIERIFEGIPDEKKPDSKKDNGSQAGSQAGK